MSQRIIARAFAAKTVLRVVLAVISLNSIPAAHARAKKVDAPPSSGIHRAPSQPGNNFLAGSRSAFVQA